MDDDAAYSQLPIFKGYKGLTDKKLLELANDPDAIKYDESGKIKQVFLYDDGTNPQKHPKYWNEYFRKVKMLSTFESK